MTLAEQAVLMSDPDFRNRIKAAALHFALYVMGMDKPIPAQNALLNWAQKAMQSPDSVAQLLQPNVVVDSKVQQAGRDITDSDLQSAVETTVNRLL